MTTVPNKNAIEISNVVKVFPIKHQEALVLRGITLSIAQNDFVIVFGHSGCGKSTLLHAILGLEQPTSGTVHMFGRNMYAYTEDERSLYRKMHIGVVYQQSNWIKSLTVCENVAFAASLTGIEKTQATRKAKEVLQTVGMAGWADYYPSELSSGQQQKVALARALITNPDIIVADEPSGNLDYQSSIELMELFRKLHTQGKTIIMVTHNIDNVDYAQTVVHMFNGRIIRIVEATEKNREDVKKMLLSRIVLSGAPDMQKGKLQTREKIRTIPNIRVALAGMRSMTGIFFSNISRIFHFSALLFLYLTRKTVEAIGNNRWFPAVIARLSEKRLLFLYKKLFTLFDKQEEHSIARVDLIDLSLKNIWSKRARTIITVGGMAIGIGTIVFLVSVGYGLEKMVISRVARLDEIRQIDTTPAVSSNIRITDTSLASFKTIEGVDKVLPVIGVVGKISYQNSSSDVAVYGVLSDYLKESAIKPAKGAIFESNEVSVKVTDTRSRISAGEVAGVHDTRVPAVPSYGTEIGEVEFRIEPEAYVRVRKEPSASAQLLGYTRRAEGTQSGAEYWGGSYISEDKAGAAAVDENGKKMGRWIKTTVPLWSEQSDTSDEGALAYKPELDTEGKQVITEGYVAELSMNVTRAYDLPEVLGVATTSSDVLAEASSSATADSEVATASATTKKASVPLPQRERQAVVNMAFLQILGVKESKGVGTRFELAFVATSELTTGRDTIQSAPVSYTIVGITPDNKTPIVYVPLVDVKELGLSNYSQAKLVANTQGQIPTIRKHVELLGFKTTSVADTVNQIERLFSGLRMVLGILGFVALIIAALGMFNTLTISLLERTHEVGMMKVIGMRSSEVQDLYLSESMIMGVLGGLCGLLIGFTTGKLLSVVLTALSVSKGYGVIDIAFIPFLFIVLIMFLSVVVGLLTGIYPARRATKISALDALRYE